MSKKLVAPPTPQTEAETEVRPAPEEERRPAEQAPKPGPSAEYRGREGEGVVGATASGFAQGFAAGAAPHLKDGIVPRSKRLVRMAQEEMASDSTPGTVSRDAGLVKRADDHELYGDREME